MGLSDHIKAAKARGIRLTRTARDLLWELARRAKGHAECFSSNATLAEALECCERTVRYALAGAKEAGLVEVEGDYTLRSRRRIRLLWVPDRGESPRQAPAEFAARPRQNLPPGPGRICRQAPAEFAARPATPPDPPFMGPEGKTEDDRRQTRESSSISRPVERTETPGPSPEIPAGLAELATKALRAPAPPEMLASLLRVWGREWLAAALDATEAAGRAGSIRTTPSAYLRGVLKGYRDQGGPISKAAPRKEWHPGPPSPTNIFRASRIPPGYKLGAVFGPGE